MSTILPSLQWVSVIPTVSSYPVYDVEVWRSGGATDFRGELGSFPGTHATSIPGTTIKSLPRIYRRSVVFCAVPEPSTYLNSRKSIRRKQLILKAKWNSAHCSRLSHIVLPIGLQRSRSIGLHKAVHQTPLMLWDSWFMRNTKRGVRTPQPSTSDQRLWR